MRILQYQSYNLLQKPKTRARLKRKLGKRRINPIPKKKTTLLRPPKQPNKNPRTSPRPLKPQLKLQRTKNHLKKSLPSKTPRALLLPRRRLSPKFLSLSPSRALSSKLQSKMSKRRLQSQKLPKLRRFKLKTINFKNLQMPSQLGRNKQPKTRTLRLLRRKR